MWKKHVLEIIAVISYEIMIAKELLKLCDYITRMVIVPVIFNVQIMSFSFSKLSQFEQKLIWTK